MKRLRKINGILALSLIVLFLMHGIMASFGLLGLGDAMGKSLAWAGVGIGAVHAIFGCTLAFHAIRTARSTNGMVYLKKDLVFWIRLFSGIAMVFLVIFHIGMFSTFVDGELVLIPFDLLRLIGMLSLVAALFIHIFVNIRPLLMTLGIWKDTETRKEFLLVLSVILVFISVSILLYYVSWLI